MAVIVRLNYEESYVSISGSATSYPVDSTNELQTLDAQRWNFTEIDHTEEVAGCHPQSLVQENQPPVVIRPGNNALNDGQTCKLPCDDCDLLYPLCTEQHETIQHVSRSLQVRDVEIIDLKRKLNECAVSLNEHPAEKIIKATCNSDLRKLASGECAKVRVWNDDSIIEGLKTRFKMSRNAYERERKKHYLPSVRTLCERTQNIHFDSGILTEIFELLASKVSSMDDQNRDCALAFDEMAISTGRDFCFNNKKFFGDVTLPDHSGLATHLMIFMLVGVRQRWKQIVAYHFTGSSVKSGYLKDIIFDIVEKSEALGLRVHAVISDCGSNNKKMWNDLNVRHTQRTVLSNESIQHPCDTNRRFEIMPDSVHVFKSAVQGWIRNKTVVLPLDVVSQHNLSSNVADIMHLHDWVTFEAKCDLKMASGLTLSDVDFFKSRNNFDKMTVINSTKFVNHTVSAALRLYSVKSNRPEVLATAVFVEKLSRWFKLVTSRSLQIALSRKNKDAYQSAIDTLRPFKHFIYGCSVGEKHYWKPWQASMILVTDSVLRLQYYFLDHNYEFIFLGRFTQDCVENIFSQIRSKHKCPRAIQAKDALRLLTLGQFLDEIENSSYENDSKEWLLNFSTILEPTNKQIYCRSMLPSNKEADEEMADKLLNDINFNDTNSLHDDLLTTMKSSEENVIYYIAGVILSSINRNSTICDDCMNSCIQKDSYQNEDHLSLFTELKDYNGNALIYVNMQTYNFFKNLEQTFKHNIAKLKNANQDVTEKLLKVLSSVEANHFPSCHRLRQKIIKRYLLFRLRSCEKKPNREKRYGSKSMSI